MHPHDFCAAALKTPSDSADTVPAPDVDWLLVSRNQSPTDPTESATNSPDAGSLPTAVNPLGSMGPSRSGQHQHSDGDRNSHGHGVSRVGNSDGTAGQQSSSAVADRCGICAGLACNKLQEYGTSNFFVCGPFSFSPPFGLFSIWFLSFWCFVIWSLSKKGKNDGRSEEMTSLDSFHRFKT